MSKKTDLRAKPRWLQRIIAKLRGCWWRPCHLCREYFGGHEKGREWLYHIRWHESKGSGGVVCPNCAWQADKLNMAAWNKGERGDMLVLPSKWTTINMLYQHEALSARISFELGIDIEVIRQPDAENREFKGGL